MRRDVQEIFRNTPHGKQVMMFSATLSKEIRPVCKKFMQDVNIIENLLLLLLLLLIVKKNQSNIKTAATYLSTVSTNHVQLQLLIRVESQNPNDSLVMGLKKKSSVNVPVVILVSWAVNKNIKTIQKYSVNGFFFNHWG